MLRKTFAIKFEPAHHESYRETALSDTKAILKHWALVGVVAFVTLGASIFGVIETDLTIFAKVLLAALGAGVGSLLILGPVVYFASLAAAPHRQRNHARGEIERLQGLALALPGKFVAFMAWARSKEPADAVPTIVFAAVGSPEALANRQSAQKYREEIDRWRREILDRYHAEFCAQLVELLNDPGRKQLQKDYGKVIREPGGLADLEVIEEALAQLAIL